MTVRVGELSSQVDVQGSGGEGAQAPAVPGWSERERHRMVAEAAARDRARVAEDRFDG